ncbi:hypothetical protein [Pseudoroseomonas cervicalis]|uniref:hypothetical protein n=1 Tax=Teichococcus cervicalis TaxID=204525 RepID=UPI0022F1591D|nr:hypothetical protein [Pseudoroseomonas cervicalis]WBV45550.1 hypothetical protein PFY06_21295 [Pseudoroseomonas cervicalis]
MNFPQMLDAAALLVLGAQAVWILLLYRRMGRLRAALEGAGAVIGQLDEASRRLDASAGGIVDKVRDGIAEVDSKIGACRKLMQELNGASRQAEEVAARLDQALRQNRKLQQARAAAPPRELVEPLGLAERLSGRPAPPLLNLAAEPVAAAPLAGLFDPPAAPLAPAMALPPVPALEPVLAATPASPLAAPLPPLAEPPLGSLLAAELLYAQRAATLPESRTIRVKLD